ncbi:MAG TPA: cytochrome c maturation protein CcmE [Ignavibacteriaceae bacterium]|jgi:cytochrome c-type biogenesis protein CcmE|nr:MAG: cytochrome c-type biogenesis protein CcmE [Ignavibacteria bacterium ADurb.Bin266]OQY70967.1 MAG: cytochrome C biogenesis protein [Ignavibacteriales bacterium UTCHB2]HQF41557.1 cytochrome c maturation protein CcmE [Ignavibacteriaceae bacterium]HQI42081.1 cytochrome c maturation protein CcmE [Ignavibacteriaceae bacterium]HQJ47226.1 cytochrome c maturation protein CcmE [Ignavibacteriaceae bacterium]
MKSKYIFGGVIIVLFLAIMGYLFTQSNIKYEDNFAVVKTTDKTVKATGSWIKAKSYEMNREQNTFSFYMSDANGNEMKVVYEGAMPNNFETATSVVVTGSYRNGYFHAKDILTKCPSKYEQQSVQSSSL